MLAAYTFDPAPEFEQVKSILTIKMLLNELLTTSGNLKLTNACVASR